MTLTAMPAADNWLYSHPLSAQQSPYPTCAITVGLDCPCTSLNFASAYPMESSMACTLDTVWLLWSMVLLIRSWVVGCWLLGS